MMSEPGAHILVFPYPAQGHMIPLLDFTHQLATLGLTITILVTPKNLHFLSPLLAAHPSAITPLVLPFPPHPAIPDGVENSAELPATAFRYMLRTLGELHNPILNWFRRHSSPLVAIISDMFLGWTYHLAVELGVCRYVFCPSGSFATSVINLLWGEMPKRQNCDDENETVVFSKIPNSPIHPWWQLSPIYRGYVEGDPVLEFVKDSFRANAASYGLVFNTFRELEGVYLDHLVKELGHNRVWSIGPLLPQNHIGSVERGWSNSVPVSEICSWLDKCQDHTVVYVCFGSQVELTNEQMEQLVLGLEKSRVKFILTVGGVTKEHKESGYDGIPPGFEDRVAGRGLVIKGWAPQVLILRHRAVCAFFTHCGWNSTLESIVAGVPMLAWPMGADQFINATLLVDQLDIGIRVCEGDEAVLDSHDLAPFLIETTSEKWMEMKARAMTLSKAALEAIKEGGSSSDDLDSFVRHLSGNYVM